MDLSLERPLHIRPTTTLFDLTESLRTELADDDAVSAALRHLLRGGYLRTATGRTLRLGPSSIVVPEDLR